MTIADRPTPAADQRQPGLAGFLRASVLLTGFEQFDLLGTGLAQQYFDAVVERAGAAAVARLCQRVEALPPHDPERHTAITQTIFGDHELSVLAQNIITLWYLGQWPAGDTAVILSPEAYQEGLVWRAIGAHPPGAKQQGFGAWSLPPDPA